MKGLAIAILLVACAKEKGKNEPPPEPTIEPLAAFEQRYGGMWVDGANAVVQTRNGGYALAGYSEKVDERYKGDYDAYVVRVDARGEVMWRRQHGQLEKLDEAYDLRETADGGFVVAGKTATNAWLAKLSRTGEIEWEKTFGGESRTRVNAIVPAGDGWYLVGTIVKSKEDIDAAVWRVNGRGEVTWEKTFGGPAVDAAKGGAALPDGSLVFVGWTGSSGSGGEDGWWVQVGADGAARGEKTYGGAEDDFFHAIAARPGGGWALAGSTRSRGAGKRDAWLVIAGADGTAEREHVYGGPHDELIDDVAIAPDGRLLLVGSVKEVLTEGLAIFVAPDGSELERRRFDDLRRDLEAAVSTSDGGWALAGDYATMNSNYGNFWLLKLDASGKGP